ncbi:hypothetical protein KDK95_31825 [Actinospica sp. MGRD01-02]|uniref:Uncharacterized protein n=1 Tax=Actinospica acidithermotolerans TaxID=2828514 RepID=A0A941IMC4_9ACTN|nr:hypothetical protein [Actinospica acidithermotolerans]MBR7830937.1 hypothetical protein [Actinospica acidithermotolerans]
MSSSGTGGVPQHEKRARDRRMRQTAKKQVRRAEIVLDKYRARAAKILHTEGMHGGAEQEKPSTYVYRILRHRETGVRVMVLDCEAPDAPASAKGEAVHRYLVQCETHGLNGDSFVSAKAALKAARRSDEWCSMCSGLMSSKPKARNRARLTARHGRRDGGGSRQDSYLP